MALTDNLISYYRLEADSTDSLAVNNGSDTAITYSSGNGKISNGAGFDGSTSKIVAKTSAILAALTNASISFWLKNTLGGGAGTAQVVPYAERGSSGNDIWKIEQIRNTGLGITVGSLAFVHRDDAGTLDNHFIPTGVVVNDGNWHHVVFTKAGVACKFYIDRELKSSGNLSGNDTMTNATLESWMGQDKGDSAAKYTGSIDEVGLWSKTLSPAEVTQLYNGGSGLQYPLSLPPFIILRG